MCTFYNNQNSIHTVPLLQHRLPAPVVLGDAMLFERKRVVQVMSRQGRSKRRMPRFPRRGGRSVLVVALHARARLLGRRRRRCRVRYARERSSDARGFGRHRRRSRWSRRRRGGGGFLRGGRTAAKHGPWGPWEYFGYGVRGGGLPQRRVQTRGEVCGESFFTPAQLAGSVVRPIEGRKTWSLKLLVSFSR